MLRYAVILSICIEVFFPIFLKVCANNFHRGLIGKCLLQTFPFLRRVTNKAQGARCYSQIDTKENNRDNYD